MKDVENRDEIDRGREDKKEKGFVSKMYLKKKHMMSVITSKTRGRETTCET